MYWRQVVSRKVMTPEFNRLFREGRSFSGNERNCCFLNTGAMRPGFADISAVSGFDFPEDGRALGKVDWDQDGDLDLWISNRNAPRLRFLRNDMPVGNHFLAVRLHGNGTTTNRDAIGARVEVILGGLRVESRGSRVESRGLRDEDSAASGSGPSTLNSQPLIKTLYAGEGFLSQSSKWLHFGLGAATAVEKIVVRWPGAEVESFVDVGVDGRYDLFQGTGQAREVHPGSRSLKLAESTIEIPKATGAERIPLVSLLPVPKLTYKTTTGSHEPLPIRQGKPLLVNLWASWCGPCRKELADLASHETEIRQMNLEVVALCVDGITGPEATAHAAADFLDQVKFPFVRGTATADLVDEFQTVHDVLIKLGLQLPVPTSFLIDEHGRLSVIYKGPVAIDKLFTDLSHASLPRVERFARSALFPGRIVDHAVPATQFEHLELSNLMEYSLKLKFAGRIKDARDQLLAGLDIADRPEFHSNLATALLAENRLAEAQTHLERALKLDPDYAAARMNLGILYMNQGHMKDAIAQYHKALELVPEFSDARFNLAKLLVNQGSIEEGVSHYEELLRQKPGLAGANYELAGALQRLGRLEEAITHYQSAVRLEPDNAPVRNDLGVALAKQNRIEEAVEQFQQALRIQSDYTEARTNLRRARKLLGQQ